MGLEMNEEKFGAEGFPLPNWAVKESDGNYMEVGAQLATRDGRKIGNAYVDCIGPHVPLGQVAVVITDIGNKVVMTAAELEELFYPPAYIMDVGEARAKRGSAATDDLRKLKW